MWVVGVSKMCVVKFEVEVSRLCCVEEQKGRGEQQRQSEDAMRAGGKGNGGNRDDRMI